MCITSGRNCSARTRNGTAAASAQEAVAAIEAEGGRAIAVLRDCGGVAVLAHPGRSQADVLIPELRRAGLHGIEAYSPSHDMHEIAHYRSLADSLGLAITAGSDFHQPTPLHPQPGVELDAEELAPFLALLAS